MEARSPKESKKIQRSRKINAPKRLPQKRPRSLTIPVPDDMTSRSWIRNLFKKPQHTFEQSESPLFARLPPEIRELIWDEFLGGHLLHIVRALKRLRAIDCTETFGPEFIAHWHGCWGSTFRTIDTSWTPGFYKCPLLGHNAKPINLLPLLQTCRRAYTEGIRLLYRNNVFEFNHIDTILSLQKSVLPQRMSQIRVVNLYWVYTMGYSIPYDLATWQKACDALAKSFCGLQELTGHLKGYRIVPDD